MNRKHFVQLGVTAALGAGGAALAQSTPLRVATAAPAAADEKCRSRSSKAKSSTEHFQNIQKRLDKLNNHLDKMVSSNSKTKSALTKNTSNSSLVSAIKSVKNELGDTSKKLDQLISSLS
jgi:hypothetical protein